MMASVWNFVKKHRGKLVLGGVVAGGLYAAHRYLEENPNALDQILRQFNFGQKNPAQPNSANGSLSETLQSQLNKHYVFDSHQRTCDTSIEQLIPTIQQKIEAKLNVEEMADRLKHGEFEGDEQKLELWNQMKIACFTRLLAASYGYSLLIAALKCQITILASDVYEKSQKAKQISKRDHSSII